MKDILKLKEALTAKSLTALTKAISELAEQMAYQLRPPFTEMLAFKAKEKQDRFVIHFGAVLHLHYASLAWKKEGLIFRIRFQGDALSDTPHPALPDLFYAGVIESLEIFGYGDSWKGRERQLEPELSKQLEVPSTMVNELDLDRFYELLEKTG
jgi:hypothetical protein